MVRQLRNYKSLKGLYPISFILNNMKEATHKHLMDEVRKTVAVAVSLNTEEGIEETTGIIVSKVLELVEEITSGIDKIECKKCKTKIVKKFQYDDDGVICGDCIE